MDRTNWQWGKRDINILTLGIVYKGIAIPICWELLDKGGNSATKERIALIQRFIDQFGGDCISGLLADREFVGDQWLSWLLAKEIPFFIRVRKNMLTTNARGCNVHVGKLFGDLRPTQERVLRGKRKIMGHALHLAGLKLSDGDFLIIATNQVPTDAIKTYALRWEIETLFSCLKTRGFHLEDTHLVDLDRIKKLLVLLSIAFCWAHKVGDWRHELHPIKIKKHGRPAISFFRYGLDCLIEAISNCFANSKLFALCLDAFRPQTLYLSALKAYR